MAALSSIALGLGAAGSVASGIMGANAASNAAALQHEAAKKANKKLKLLYHAQKDDLMPWMKGGLNAFKEMGSDDFKRDFTMADYQADPGYAFRMAEGMKALERSAAARGGLRGGGTLKALTRYSQDVASQEYQNAYNRFNADRDRRFGRLSSLAGYGMNATGMLGNLRQNYGNAYSANTMGAANAQGAAGMASANAWGNAFSGIGQMGMDMYALNKKYPGQG